MTRQDTETDTAPSPAVVLAATTTDGLLTAFASLTHRLHALERSGPHHLADEPATDIRAQRDLIRTEILRRAGGATLDAAEPAHWDDPVLNACESAPCPCGHNALDHAWHGCEECECSRSGINAVLASGVVAVALRTPSGEGGA